MPADAPPLSWSIDIRDATSGAVLLQRNPDHPLRTASIGKVLLLIHLARQITSGRLAPLEPVRRLPEDSVADSGLWQHLAVDSLPIADLCTLVGSVSDNLATNVLLRRVGLDAVAGTATDLGLVHTALHDRVRDHRTAENPPTLSTGSAADLTRLMTDLHRGTIFDPATSATVLGWLAHGTDLSQVAAHWGLDPLAHAAPDRGLTLHHKTGTDTDVRAETGLLTGPRCTVAYTVIANWSSDTDLRDPVLAEQARLGEQIAAFATSSQRRDF